jgi:hypothetical protein
VALPHATARLKPGTSWQARACGVLLALLVQAALIAGAILSLTRPVFFARPHETILVLRSLPKPRIIHIDARGSRSSRISPAPQIVPSQNPPSENPSPPFAPAPDFKGFGRSLFGCAPEHYADLPAEERAHCPKPGEGLAREPDLATPPRSHARDELYWQEQFRRARMVYGICPPGPVPIAQCLLEQDRAEHQREQEADHQIAGRKAAALQQPKRPPPRIGALYTRHRNHPMK